MKTLLEAINRGILKGLTENNIELLADLDNSEIDQLDSLQTKSVNNKMHALYRYFPKTKKELVEIIKAEVEKKGWNCSINHIDVSQITDMSYLFSNDPYSGYELGEFNGDISRWNVSNVTTTRGMFKGAESFNQPIGNWDVSNVVDMCGMFARAISFNQPIGDWNVSNVTNMEHTFFWTESFNQPIGDWNVSNVTTMRGMFYLAESFNQPIGDWDVSNVTDMQSMFYDADSFNQDLSKWKHKTNCNTYKIFYKCPIKEEYMPNGIWISKGVYESNMRLLTDLGDSELDQLDSIQAKSVNSKIQFKYFPKTKDELVKIIKSEVEKNGWNCDLNHIDTSRITDMSYLFSGDYYSGYKLGEFNGDISRWNVSNVKDMESMFSYAKSFNQPIGDWDVSSVTNMRTMFFYADKFNQPIGDWNVSNVGVMRQMFQGAKSFNQDLTRWKTYTIGIGMFDGCPIKEEYKTKRI